MWIFFGILNYHKLFIFYLNTASCFSFNVFHVWQLHRQINVPQKGFLNTFFFLIPEYSQCHQLSSWKSINTLWIAKLIYNWRHTVAVDSGYSIQSAPFLEAFFCLPTHSLRFCVDYRICHAATIEMGLYLR